jgi:hypothetical protein
MNTTKNEHYEAGDGSGRSQRRIRRLACISVALITSAGVGALVGSASASTARRPPVAVVPDHPGSGTQLSGPDTQCTPTQPRSRVVLLAFQVSNADCTKPPMLVNVRTTDG